MPLQSPNLALKQDFVPQAELGALMAELAPFKPQLIERWLEAHQRSFDGPGSFAPEALRAHMNEELALLIDAPATGTLDQLWPRLEANGRHHAEEGVPYAELVLMMGLLEECVATELAAHGASVERRFEAYKLFDRLTHYRIAKLAQSYFDRYVELLQEKSRALAEQQDKHELELMRAEKLAGLGQLAGGVAHELNNPLATISITVEDLQDALTLEAKDVVRSWPDLGPALERIRSSVKRCIGIIGGMLDLARHRPPTNEEFAVNDLVKKVAEVSALSSASRSRKITLHLDPQLGAARSDPRQIEQVLMALISNALDAVEPAGAVTVTTRQRGDLFELEVSDDGCGIPAEHRERIFEPFFTTKPPGKGTGLGLSMAYSTVKRLEGRLTIDSGPGKGTNAIVVLPIRSTRLG